MGPPPDPGARRPHRRALPTSSPTARASSPSSSPRGRQGARRGRRRRARSRRHGSVRRRPGPRRAREDVVASELSNKMAWTTRQPIGVVGMITPWNFPVAIPSWKCFPALLAGNGIVLKPSEHTPLCADAFVDALRRPQASRPALLQVVHGARRARCGTRGAPRRRRAVASRARCPPAGKVAARGDGDRPAPRVARARRQERDGRPRRRRPRPRRRRRAVRRVRHVGPALHLDVAPRRAPRGRRPTVVERVAKRAEALVLGDPTVADDRRRSRDRSPLGRAHHRDDRARGRRGRDRRDRRARASRSTAARAARSSLRRC